MGTSSLSSKKEIWVTCIVMWTERTWWNRAKWSVNSPWLMTSRGSWRKKVLSSDHDAAKNYISLFEMTLSPYIMTIFINQETRYKRASKIIIISCGDWVQSLKLSNHLTISWKLKEQTIRNRRSKRLLDMKRALGNEWDSYLDPLGFVSPKEQTVDL